MASILRRLVAGPRSRHPEADLDLCYVTDEIIATSGPSSTYPQLAYRNSLESLVRFLDERHSSNWAIWEFRAEGTGYPDSAVYDRIWHYPFPDHHPPPFALIPLAMASMRNWLKNERTHEASNETNDSTDGRVIVVHCKAGKGRSGTMACSYLISECGWTPSEALARFTERRMRSGFGHGVSIPSQLRYVHYVDQWTKQSKIYLEREIEILEIYVWGLRDGVKTAVEGYVDEGKVIKTIHVFSQDEQTPLIPTNNASPLDRHSSTPVEASTSPSSIDRPFRKSLSQTSQPSSNDGTTDVVLRPSAPLYVPTNDINIDFERRATPSFRPSFSMVTSVAHVWFNAFFEAHAGASTGSFAIDWEKMDGIKGSTRKGTQALDRVKVVWRARSGGDVNGEETERRIRQPEPGEEVREVKAADWKSGVGRGAKGEEDKSEERRVAGVGLSLVAKGVGEPGTKKRVEGGGSW